MVDSAEQVRRQRGEPPEPEKYGALLVLLQLQAMQQESVVDTEHGVPLQAMYQWEPEPAKNGKAMKRELAAAQAWACSAVAFDGALVQATQPELVASQTMACSAFAFDCLSLK